MTTPRFLPPFASALLLWLAFVFPARAVDDRDLLPIDQAFELSATADGSDAVRLHWKIADGYYLYRHRMSAQASVGSAGALELPEGTAHHDEFFGDVQTYRKSVSATVPAVAARDGKLTLQVKYQGCADAGICYPPHTRTVTVAMPAVAPAASGEGDGATRIPAGGAPNALSRALGSMGSSGPVAGASPGATDGAPLPAEQAFGFEAIVGDGNTILMRFTPAKGYYLYRDRSSFALNGTAGFKPGKPRWPAGSNHHDEHFGDVVVYFDQVDVPLPIQRSSDKAADIVLTATFQGCQTGGICYPPMTRKTTLSLPAGTVATSDAEKVSAPAFAQPPPGIAGIAGSPGKAVDDTDAPTTSQPATSPGAAPAGDASADNASRTGAPPTASVSVMGAVLLALLGGLLLNAMPCVLPILSLKVLGLAQSGGDRAQARRHALFYGAGVLVSFAAIGLLVVGLRAAGHAFGWGFQLQQPGFVAALALLMAAIGLSLSGVFTVGGSANIGQSLASRSGPAGDFFTGVLAVVVATPCVAPFMGTALAYAFTASVPAALLVFVALGVGLAFPFVLIGFVPALAQRLPRPGPWMDTFKQLLAFPMYLTAVWLAWVLGKQRGVDAMALLAAGTAVLALALWWWEKSRQSAGWTGRIAALALLVIALAPVWLVGRMAAPARGAAEQTDASGQVAYSAQRLQELRAKGEVVFVNMTADWCVTCKANERSTLSRPAFREAMQRTKATYMVGDWTNVDPEIGKFLEAHNAVGVPLYVVYPRGGGPGEVLPAVLDPATAAAALERAADMN